MGTIALEPAAAAAMPHATAHSSPPEQHADPSAAARRPAPIQTSPSKSAQAATAPDSPERPPVSPITPTDTPALSLPPSAYAHASAAHSVDGSSDDRPLSRTSFTFNSTSQTPPRAGSTASRPPKSTSTTPPRPPSISSLPYHFQGPSPHPPSAASAGAAAAPLATFMPQPPSLPLDESSNTDVAALKACISVLQLQQAKSRRDIATLQRLRDAASADPAGFTAELQSGRLSDASAAADPLAATFADDDDDDEADDDDAAEGPTQDPRPSKFEAMPRPQNVVRCPPVNWAKYHVVGEPLDRMHDEQRRRPDPGEPWRDGPRDALVWAPYSPFRDQLAAAPQPSPPSGTPLDGQQPGMVTRKGGKRPG